jgi:hypothetical protein
LLAIGVPVVSDFDPLGTGAYRLARYRLILAGAGVLDLSVAAVKTTDSFSDEPSSQET